MDKIQSDRKFVQLKFQDLSIPIPVLFSQFYLNMQLKRVDISAHDDLQSLCNADNGILCKINHRKYY
jgi:hypothetical protein